MHERYERYVNLSPFIATLTPFALCRQAQSTQLAQQSESQPSVVSCRVWLSWVGVLVLLTGWLETNVDVRRKSEFRSRHEVCLLYMGPVEYSIKLDIFKAGISCVSVLETYQYHKRYIDFGCFEVHILIPEP